MSELESPLPEHLIRPHIRNFQPLGLQHENKPIVVLRDPAMLSQESMAVPPQILPLILQFQGRESLEEIETRTKAPMKMLRELVTRMDQLGLLWGPRFEELERVAMANIRQAGHFPVRASGAAGPDADAVRKRIADWMDKAEDPEIPGTVVGIVAPHLDLERGWQNYASAYRSLNTDAPPDRVVILGTNHFGIGDGVVMSEFGFESPLGVLHPDRAVHAFLERSVGGKRLYADQMDHLGEHSIQLHLPWLQHLYGDVSVVAALMPDPLRPPIADDGARAGAPEFIEALRTALGEVGGRTLFISSADLSHVGPAFGDNGPVTDQVAKEVEQLDRERLRLYCAGDPDAFEQPFAAQRNISRWCSLGNMGALLRLARPSAVELIDYLQVREANGGALVSSAAIAVTA